MKLFHDWEFLEDGSTIEPISVGMVREDGAEYYAVFADMPTKRIAEHDWLMANVVPSLPRMFGEMRMAFKRSNPLGLDWTDPAVKARGQIRDEVKTFLLGTPDLELYGWYSSYDHVCLAQLFGRMIDLPSGVPMWTNDLRQEVHRLGLSEADLPKQADGVHNALADARHYLLIADRLDAEEAAARAAERARCVQEVRAHAADIAGTVDGPYLQGLQHAADILEG